MDALTAVDRLANREREGFEARAELLRLAAAGDGEARAALAAEGWGASVTVEGEAQCANQAEQQHQLEQRAERFDTLADEDFHRLEWKRFQFASFPVKLKSPAAVEVVHAVTVELLKDFAATSRDAAIRAAALRHLRNLANGRSGRAARACVVKSAVRLRRGGSRRPRRVRTSPSLGPPGSRSADDEPAPRRRLKTARLLLDAYVRESAVWNEDEGRARADWEVGA
jgi:hypothetical protein